MFLAVTAEEKGLLGSEYYAANPLYPLGKTVGVLNIDVLGDCRPGARISPSRATPSSACSTCWSPRARSAAATHPDPRPEAGSFYRSDHFTFAKARRPGDVLRSGQDLVKAARARQGAGARSIPPRRYHQPADEWSPDWDFTGIAEDAGLLHAVGRDLANSRLGPSGARRASSAPIRDQTAADAPVARRYRPPTPLAPAASQAGQGRARLASGDDRQPVAVLAGLDPAQNLARREVDLGDLVASGLGGVQRRRPRRTGSSPAPPRRRPRPRCRGPSCASPRRSPSAARRRGWRSPSIAVGARRDADRDRRRSRLRRASRAGGVERLDPAPSRSPTHKSRPSSTARSPRAFRRPRCRAACVPALRSITLTVPAGCSRYKRGTVGADRDHVRALLAGRDARGRRSASPDRRSPRSGSSRSSTTSRPSRSQAMPCGRRWGEVDGPHLVARRDVEQVDRGAAISDHRRLLAVRRDGDLVRHPAGRRPAELAAVASSMKLNVSSPLLPTSRIGPSAPPSLAGRLHRPKRTQRLQSSQSSTSASNNLPLRQSLL